MAASIALPDISKEAKCALEDFFRAMGTSEADRVMGWGTGKTGQYVRAGRMGYIQFDEGGRKYVTPALLAEFVISCTHHVGGGGDRAEGSDE